MISMGRFSLLAAAVLPGAAAVCENVLIGLCGGGQHAHDVFAVDLFSLKISSSLEALSVREREAGRERGERGQRERRENV